MRSLWEVYSDEILTKGCDWCAKDGEYVVYDFFGESICRECLENEEYEEPEKGLTPEERNKL